PPRRRRPPPETSRGEAVVVLAARAARERRRIVGCSIDSRTRSSLAVAALQNTVTQCRPDRVTSPSASTTGRRTLGWRTPAEVFQPGVPSKP
ncbi:MAG TPA: hypothetical protein VIK32_05560, partial [Candidatus Limnocylindrales bacterium]